MFDLTRALACERLMKSLTGMKTAEFKQLTQVFGKILHETAAQKKRERKVGGGQKGALRGIENKLFFILFYLKCYPTFDVAGFIFHVDRSRPCRWAQKFLPILEKVLKRTLSLPKRKIRSIDELFEFFPEAKDLFVDGTERRVQRSKTSKNQKRRYSGKKKTHTRKNAVIAAENRRILLVSKTKNGREHDLTQLRKTGVLRCIPPGANIWGDKAYQGIKEDVGEGVGVYIPHKKPKKRELTHEQKEENKVISGIRIVVEHAIGGIKRFKSLSDVFRNKKGQDDSMVAVCAGLWNYHLQNT